MSKIPSEEILESLFKLRIRESDQLKTVFEICTTWRFIRRYEFPTLEKLKTMEKRSFYQKLRLRNLDAEQGKSESGAVIKTCQALKEEKVSVTSGKKKASVRNETVCSFRHESQDRAQRPAQTAATPSEPTASRGRNVSRKRSIRSKSNHRFTLRQPCRCYLRGTCKRTVVRLKTRVCFRIAKVGEQPNKKQKKEILPKKERKRWQECCGYCEKRITIVLRLARLGSTGFSKRKIAFRETRCKVLGSIRKVRFTESSLRQANIRAKRGPSLSKIQVKIPHLRGLYATKFEDKSHEETEREQRCARSMAWNLAKNMNKLK